MEQGYNGFSIHCGGSIAIQQEYKWVDWDKRTPRIEWKRKKKSAKKLAIRPSARPFIGPLGPFGHDLLACC